MLTAAGIKAQQQPDHFLNEIFSINSFKLNSPLEEIQKHKDIAKNLSFFYKEDNSSVYFLADQKVNLPGLKVLDKLAFDTLELTFENNKLHDVRVNVPARFKDQIFIKTINQFNFEYGNASILAAKRRSNKKYVWDLGVNEIIITIYQDSFGIDYMSKKKSTREKSWIYSFRKGKGKGTIKLTLPYFEQLIKSGLTVTSFEKLLPSWETTGLLNHVRYEYNFKFDTDKGPVYSITYSLANYNISITTIDTTSKIITSCSLEKVKDVHVWEAFELGLKNSHYKIRPRVRYSMGDSYTNREKHTMVIFDKPDSTIVVIDTKLPLP